MISVSYNFSSNDFEFLENCIRESKLISDDIHFASVTKFFNGEDENCNLIEKSKEICNLNGVSFHCIQYDDDLRNYITGKKRFYKHWHNTSRLVNTNNCKYDYILYLDGDEVVDGRRFNEWISSIKLEQHNSYVFDSFWYFRSKKYQATTYEKAGILVNKNSIRASDIMNINERWGLATNPKICNVISTDNIPMIHHYSWAKGNTDSECEQKLLNKVKCWGHTSDRDWVSLIREEFSRPFNGTDFVHGYKYNILE